MAVEGQRAAAFVWDALKNDAGPGGVNTLLAGRIYRDLVPQAATLPAATVTLVSDTDENTLGGVRVFGAVLIDVRVISTGANYTLINPIADRVDAVLQNRSGTMGNVVIVELRRNQSLAFVETEAGVTYTHLVQTFRTEAFAAT